MTMDYLVTMVMDAGSDRPADWYDFLWNRTRAIRKVRLCACISGINSVALYFIHFYVGHYVTASECL